MGVLGFVTGGGRIVQAMQTEPVQENVLSMALLAILYNEISFVQVASGSALVCGLRYVLRIQAWV